MDQISGAGHHHRGTQVAAHVINGQSSRVALSAGFDPYGDPNVSQMTSDAHIYDINPFRWGGRDQTWDEDYRADTWRTMTMGVRQHSPLLQGFLQPDSLPGQQGTTDTAYSYVGYDPVNKIDPDGLASCSVSTKLTTSGRAATAAHNIKCVNSVQREVRQVLTYNFCVRGRGATKFDRNQCSPGGDVVDVTYTYFNGKSPEGQTYYRYAYDKNNTDRPYGMKPRAAFSQTEYNTLFASYCLTYVPLVHSTLQWREMDSATKNWTGWTTSFKPGKPKKATPLGWGKALKCPGF